VTFNTNQNPGIQLPNTQFLLFTAVISPGSSINPSGTNVRVSNPSSGTFKYGIPTNPISISGTPPAPSNYDFLVVPEPTTYALGAVATAMLGGVGFYRRKKAVKSL
jgi:hypothetical protein